jgi:hypothetical protein
MSRTGHEVIVDHAGRLHQGVADSRADEFESALNEVAAHGVGFRCARRDLSHSPPTILFRFAADKAPQVTVETAELFPNREKGVRILDRRRNLQSVAHDPGVAEQPFQIARAVAHDRFRAKTVERFTVVLAFIENRRPAQTGLRALEDQKLEELSVVMDRHAPFLIVVGDVGFGSRPGTTRHMSDSREQGVGSKE